MNNNIEFSIMPNKAHTKFKIAWTVNLGEYPTTRTLSREFGSEEAAKEHLGKYQETYIKAIREKLSKMVINIKEETNEEVVEETNEEVVEETNEEVVEETNEEVVEETNEEVVEETNEEVVEETNEEVVEETNEEVVEETNEEVDFDVDSEYEEDDDELALVAMMGDDADSEENKQEETETMVPRNKKKKHITRRVLAFVLAIVLSFLAGYHLKKNQEQTQDGNVDEPGIETPVNPGTEDEEEENILTTEEFETLAANFIKLLQDKNINVTTADITKFVSIVNVDRLVEENPELAKTLFADNTKEEYIQDAANIIGRTCQYNAKTFNNDKNTENFIRISNALSSDEQKEKLLIIESYVDKIAAVSHDAEKVNELVAELVYRLTMGDLQNLDYGVQFAMQPSIELIRSYIAKDVLTEENANALTGVTRLDVSEIMYMFDNVQGLNGTTKTLK